MKNSNYTIGNRTRDLLTCSAVPQPTAPPRSPIQVVDIVKYVTEQRIKRLRHRNRMKDIRLVHIITDWNSVGVRIKGWPNINEK